MIKILGLDVSSVCTGYSVVEDGYLLTNTIGTIKPNSKDCIGKKLVFFEKKIKNLLKKYNPDYVVTEDIFKGPNVKTFKTLAMFRGIVFKTVYEKLKNDPVCLMPTEARKIAGVKGITKEDAFIFITEKYNFLNYKFVTHNDISDSIILALASYYLYKNPKQNVIKKKKRKNEKSL